MNIGFQTSGLSGFTRVAYLWRRHASAVLWIAMAALLPTACSDDAEQSVPQANGHTAVIYLNFKTGASKQAAEMNTSQSSETPAPADTGAPQCGHFQGHGGSKPPDGPARCSRSRALGGPGAGESCRVLPQPERPCNGAPRGRLQPVRRAAPAPCHGPCPAA